MRQDGGGTWQHKGAERVWRLGVRVPLVDIVNGPQTNGPVEIIPGTVEMPIPDALDSTHLLAACPCPCRTRLRMADLGGLMGAEVAKGELKIQRTPQVVGDIEVFNPRVVQ